MDPKSEQHLKLSLRTKRRFVYVHAHICASSVLAFYSKKNKTKILEQYIKDLTISELTFS